MQKTLDEVQSWYYYIHRDSDLAQAMQDIRGSTVDMVVLTPVNPEPLSLYELGPQDPIHDKIILGYVNNVEAVATDYLMRQEFENGLPTWAGAPHHPWPELYSVRFWEPQWEAVMHRYIDARIAAGFDGIFFDGSPYGWTEGNTLGNSPRDDVLGDLYRMYVNLREYIDQKQLDRPFYLVANGVHDVAAAYPGLYEVLDGVLLESLAWVFAPDDHLASVPSNYSIPELVARIDGIYGDETVVFTVDYPPLQGLDDMFDVFRQAAEAGWRPSISHDAHQDGAALRDGARQAVATADNSAVIGEPSLVNMLSAAQHAGVTLTGGRLGDYLVAGPGATFLEGGMGNDRLYMHPQERYGSGHLEVRLSSTVTAGSAPHVVIRVNDAVVLADTVIDASHGVSSQSFLIPIPAGGLQSLDLEVSGCTFVDANHFSHLDIDGVFIAGQPVPLTEAAFANGGVFSMSADLAGYSNDGGVSFPPGVLAGFRVNLGATATVADGGVGTDEAVYDGASGTFDWQRVGDGWTVVAPSLEVSDALEGVERLRFDDIGIALDLDGTAGLVAKILGAVFGPWAVSQPQYVAQGLLLADSGMAEADLVAIAFELRLGANHSFGDEVALLYQNVLQRAPSLQEVELCVDIAAQGGLDADEFALFAMDLPVTLSAIGFGALQENGLAYAV